MRVIDVVAEILRRERVEFLSCYPTTSLIDAAARAGIRPVVCRQERVGVGIADGFSRTTGGQRLGVFAMQWGPGAENAFAGIASAYADSIPILLLPLGHSRARSQLFPLFSATRSFASVTKSVETVVVPELIGETMRRAFSNLRNGRPGPVMVEIPEDVAEIDVGDVDYSPPVGARSEADPADVEAAVEALIDAKRPVVLAGQGVLFGGASDELVQLAESLQLPVMSTLKGKSSFPEDHPLSLGTASSVMTGPGYQFMRDADLIFAIGASLTDHMMSVRIPAGKTIIHATLDARDLNKSYAADHALIGDAKLVLGQMLAVLRNSPRHRRTTDDGEIPASIERIRTSWLKDWRPKLASRDVPINPYRVIADFMKEVRSEDAIVTHDSGSPRDQIVPFYRATTPHCYIGWGKSHALGSGLGLTIGAKLASPDKLCVHFMGDAAFGMTGLDIETAARAGIPILAVVLNNGTMAIETDSLVESHQQYRTRDVGGSYATLARGLGLWAERVDDPRDIRPAIRRARRQVANGRASLLEFMTSAETAFSYKRPFEAHRIDPERTGRARATH